MTRPRLTIAQLMALILYVGLGFAALRNADVFWASTTFTVAIITVSVALVGAIAREGKARMTWTGFAVFGWACLIIGLWPTRTVGTGFGLPPQVTPPLLMTWGVFCLQRHIQPISFDPNFFAAYVQISRSLEIILFGLVGAVVGCLVAVKDDLPNP